VIHKRKKRRSKEVIVIN